MKNFIYYILIFIFINTISVFTDTSASFKGKVINIDGNCIELKKGEKEITLYITENTKFIYKDREIMKESIEICQSVKADFVVNKERNELKKLEILKESYCTR